MNENIDKKTVLAKIRDIRFPQREKHDGIKFPDDGYRRYLRKLDYLSEILETNEDLLYGLFWDEYTAWLAKSDSERWHSSKMFMDIFDGIVQKPTPRAVRFAGGLLLDPHYPVRDFVAEGLGRMGSLDAYLYLIAVVHHEDFQIATRAIRALGEVKAVQAESLLIAFLTGSDQTNTPDDKDIIQAYALEGLVLLDTITAWEAIETVAIQPNLDNVLRSDAITVLAENKGTEVIPLLQWLVSDKSQEVQDTATFYLKNLKESSVPERERIFLVDSQGKMLALIEIESIESNLYCGHIIKKYFPIEIEEILDEFDEIVNEMIFSLLDEIQAKIESLDLLILEQPGSNPIQINDLQIFKDGNISFRIKPQYHSDIKV